MDILHYLNYVWLVWSTLNMIFSFIPGVKADGGSASMDERDLSPSSFFYQQRVNPRDCKELQSQCRNNAMNYTGVFLIRPAGSLEPFQVYCDNDFDLGGWTVIQRRKEFSVGFTRNWTDYKTGFGFFSTEFWIGNDKLSYLTNQAVCELRIDIMLSNGSSFYIKYDSFRISDEWSQYTIFSVGRYEGNANKVYSTCSSNMTYGSCRCQPTCNDPQGNSCSYEECPEDETCICSDGFLRLGNECVLARECPCFLAEIDRFIANNTSYVNADCSKKCTCLENQLSCNLDYECSSGAYCSVVDDKHQCYCNDGYAGDGETCRPLYTDCYDVLQDGQINDGIYTVLPSGWPGAPFNVYCDMTTAGGGWTVFQRRVDDSTDFYLYWDDYKEGFGLLTTNYWLGNDHLYYLTNQKAYTLRVDLEDFEDNTRYAEYDNVRVSDEATKYTLSLGSYSGDAGDAMANCKGQRFSTRDDENGSGCPDAYKGGWWYGSCHHANLNGLYLGGTHTTYADGIEWYQWKGYYYSLKFTEMKIRPTNRF